MTSPEPEVASLPGKSIPVVPFRADMSSGSTSNLWPRATIFSNAFATAEANRAPARACSALAAFFGGCSDHVSRFVTTGI